MHRIMHITIYVSDNAMKAIRNAKYVATTTRSSRSIDSITSARLVHYIALHTNYVSVFVYFDDCSYVWCYTEWDGV